MVEIKKVAILGAGNAGQEIAGWLAHRGCEVFITDLFKEQLDKISNVKEVELQGELSCKGNITVVSDPSECVRGAELVVLVTAAPGHEAIIKKASSGFKDNQIIMVQPGYWSHVTIPNWLRRAGINKNLIYAQTDSLLHTCRVIEPGKVLVCHVKDSMSLAVCPRERGNEIFQLLQPFWPQLHLRENAFEVTLNNVNYALHPTIMLINASNIENQNYEWYFYRQGVTQSVVTLIQKIDDERMALGNNLGLSLDTTYELLKKYYPVPQATDLMTQLTLNPAFETIKAPETLHYRYFYEDIPFGLIPMIRLGKAINLEMPFLQPLVNLVIAMLQCDLYENALKMDDLGLSGLKGKKLIEAIHKS
jgi:opine dehydrogenase